MRQNAKAELLPYLDGAVGERYEVAEALALRGTKTDIPALKKLLADKNTDLKVAAAKALLRIN
jgi:HEAT repeat protein